MATQLIIVCARLWLIATILLAVLSPVIAADAMVELPPPGTYRVNGGELVVQRASRHPPNLLRIDPKARLLAETSGDGFRLYSIPQRILLRWRHWGESVTDLVFLPNQRHLYVAHSRGSEVYHLENDRFISNLMVDEIEDEAAAITRDGRTLAVILRQRVDGNEGNKREEGSLELLWGRVTEEGKFDLDRNSAQPFEDRCQGLGISANGRFVVAHGKGGQLIVRDRQSPKSTQVVDLGALRPSWPLERYLWVTDDGLTVIAFDQLKRTVRVGDVKTGTHHAMSSPGVIRSVVGLTAGNELLIQTEKAGPRRVKLSDRVDATEVRAFSDIHFLDYCSQLDLAAFVENGGISLLDLKRNFKTDVFKVAVIRPFRCARVPGKPAVYVGVGGTQVGARVLRIDLSTGAVRDASDPRIDPLCSGLVGLSNDLKSIVDIREPRSAPITIEGLKDAANLKWLHLGRRDDAPWVVGVEGSRVAVVDAVKRTLIGDFQRASESGTKLGVPVLASLLDRSGHLLLIDDLSNLETWDLSASKLLARRKTSLKALWGTQVVECPDKTLKVSSLEANNSQLLVSASNPSEATTNRRDWFIHGFNLADGRFARDMGGKLFIERSPPAIGEAIKPVVLTNPGVKFESIAFLDELDRAVSIGSNCLTVWDLTSGKRLSDIYLTAAGEGIFVTPTGEYLATAPQALQAVTLVRGLEASFADQFDLALFQPGYVLETIGLADVARIKALNALRDRRLARHDPPKERNSEKVRPQFQLTGAIPSTVDERTVELPLRLEAAGTALPAKLYTWVNGVAVPSSRGQAVEAAGRMAFDHSHRVSLGPGANRIATQLEDSAGGLSERRELVVNCAASFSDSNVYLLAVGVSKYPREDRELRFAASDVGAIAEAMSDLLGTRVHVEILTDEKARRDKILAMRSFLEKAQMQDQVIIYLAGHGALDATGQYHFLTVDADFDKINGGLSFIDIENLVDGLSAGGKWIFLDSCHSGRTEAVTRLNVTPAGIPRGVSREMAVTYINNSIASLDQAFADLRFGTGATVVAAAGGAELAYETDQLQRGYFTHTLIECLQRGDGAQSDGVMRLSGLIESVNGKVRALTHGVQRPQVKEAPFGLDLPLITPPKAQLLWRIPNEGFSTQAAMSDDGTMLAILAGERIHILGWKQGKVHKEWPVPKAATEPKVYPSLRWSPDGKTIWMTVNGSTYYCSWNTSDVWELLRHKEIDIKPVCFSADSRWMWARDEEWVDYLTDLTALPPVSIRIDELMDKTGGMDAITFDPKARAFVAIHDRTVHKLSIDGDKPRAKPGINLNLADGIGRAALSPNGRYGIRSAQRLPAPEIIEIFDTVANKVTHQWKPEERTLVTVVTPSDMVPSIALAGRRAAAPTTHVIMDLSGRVLAKQPIPPGAYIHDNLVLVTSRRIAYCPPRIPQPKTGQQANTDDRFIMIDRQSGRPAGWFTRLAATDMPFVTPEGHVIFVSSEAVYGIPSVLK